MEHFLLVYDRTAGALVREIESFDSGVEAMRARFKAEIEFESRTEFEIVAISASSIDELKRTHGRYFFTLSELIDRMSRIDR